MDEEAGAADALVAAKLVEEGADAAILLVERLAAGRRHAPPVVEPGRRARVGRDFLPALHLPLPEMDLLEARLAKGVGVAAIGGQADAAAQGAGPDLVEGEAREARLDLGGLALEARLEGDVRLAVGETRGDVDRGVPDEIDVFHALCFNEICFLLNPKPPVRREATSRHPGSHLPMIGKASPDIREGTSRRSGSRLPRTGKGSPRAAGIVSLYEKRPFMPVCQPIA